LTSTAAPTVSLETNRILSDLKSIVWESFIAILLRLVFSAGKMNKDRFDISTKRTMSLLLKV
jgi:hypothetical protein